MGMCSRLRTYPLPTEGDSGGGEKINKNRGGSAAWIPSIFVDFEG